MVAPLLLGSLVFALLLAYRIARPRLHCEPIDERPVVQLQGRIVGPKAAGEVVCHIDAEVVGAGAAGVGEAELPLIVDFSGDKVLVLARGAVVSARWPHRGPHLRVGDRIAVAGVLGDLRREESLYREAGCAFGLEALRIVAGGLPRVRGLGVPLVASGALMLACLLLLLTPLGQHHAALIGVPCPAGTRLGGRPEALGATAWTQVCRDARGRAQGPTVRWSKAGARLAEGSYRHGRLEGAWTVWRGAGRKIVEGRYRAGQREGRWTEWTPTGRVRSRGSYERGKKSGRWTVWGDICPSWGGARSSATYAYPHRLQYLGKVQRMACTYREGLLHGPFTLWLATGTRLDGHFSVDRNYEGVRASVYDGRWVWRNAAGQKLLESRYRRGRAHGRWIRWSAKGQRLLEGSFRSDGQGAGMSGRWTRYRLDGTVAWACAFGDGLAAGWLPPCRQGHYRCRNLSAKCDARLAHIVPRRPEVRGALSMTEVERAIYPALDNIWPCDFSPSSLKRSGRVTIGLKIRRGWVEGAWLVSSSLPDAYGECLAEHLSRASRFRADGETTHVTYSFDLFPKRYLPWEFRPSTSDDDEPC